MAFVTLDKRGRPSGTAPERGSAGRRGGRAARPGTPSTLLPSVNLLSPLTLEALAVRRLRSRFVAAGLVGAMLVGGAWAVQTHRLDNAQDRLADEQALTPPLTAQMQALEPVARFYSQVAARKSTAAQAMAAEVLFSKALADLVARTPGGMDITAMSVTLTPSVVSAVAPPTSPLAEAGIDAAGNVTTARSAGATGSATPGAGTDAATTGAGPVSCARPDPFKAAAIIGCVTISGTADSRAVVGQLVNNLREADLYADPFVTTTTVGGAERGSGEVQFAGSVGLTGEAVSGRYADLSWLADPAVLAGAERMVAAGNTAGRRLAGRTQARAEAAEERAAQQKAAAEAAEERAAEQQRLEQEAALRRQIADAAAAQRAGQVADPPSGQATQPGTGEGR